MNVIVTYTNGCLYLCEFRNNMNKINCIADASPKNKLLNFYLDDMFNNYHDTKWNQYMNTLLEILENAGCTILYD